VSDDATGDTSRRRNAGFTRVPRTPRTPSNDVDRRNFVESLDGIETLLHHAVEGGRRAFARDSPAYASGAMVIIRTAALFEVSKFATFLGDVPDEVVRGITTTRNIAAHSGYRAMNDDLLWDTLTEKVPPLIESWREAAR
jgi:hypothetical protein